ncbi:MAG TPA: class I adenylate-forming enzyme family protein [Acidimicrobiales bacterium]|nr:class I adenylate-forming enzyme family protein [Acidimicrobiales bacterium]
MPLSYEEAMAAVTAPGQRFEVGTAVVRGVETKVFVNAPLTLREALGMAHQRGDQPFLVYEDERWSFGDVGRQVAEIGSVLVNRYGVRKGDRVAIAMRNYPEWVTTFAAVVSIGAISVSMNAWWTEAEIDYALEDSGAKVLVADPERLARSAGPAARLGVRLVGVRLAEGAELPAGAERLDDVLVAGAELPEVEIDPDDDATILYTSGTTGQPKGAVSTHRAILQALMGFGCRVAGEALRRQSAGDGAASPAIAAEPVFILVVPLFHVTGCVAVMLSCYLGGAKLVMMYKWDPGRALELIERERVTNFVGVPTQSWDLIEHPRFSEFDTSSLLSVGGGGAPAPPELVRRVASNFGSGRPGIGYGMTETNAYGPQNAGEDYLSHPTSTGRGTPILDLEVRDPDGRPLPAGERGEIWFKGPHLIRGYWNKPEATAETIVDGWLRSGDVGRIDEEGFVYVEDRAKDMVLRGGENVYCAEVEAVIYEHPAVYEAAVFGVPHERLGEEVAAAVYPKPGATLTPEELREHVAQRLAPFKVPSRVVIVGEALPRNAAGKILKRQLREELAGAGAS